MRSFWKTKNKNREIKKIFSFTHKYIKGHYFSIILIVFILILGSSLANVVPYIWGYIIDAITNGDFKALFQFLFIYIALTFISICMGFLETYIGSKTCFEIEKNIKENLMEKVLFMRCENLDGFDTGSLSSRITADANEVVTFTFTVITSIISTTITLLTAFIFSVSISWSLSLVSFAFIPLSIVTNRVLQKSYKQLGAEQKEYGDKITATRIDLLSHIFQIKSYNLEKKQCESYSNLMNFAWTLQKKQIKLSNKETILSNIINISSLIATIILSAYLIAEKYISFGEMTAFQKYIDKLNGAIDTFLKINISAQTASVAVDRMVNIFSFDDELPFVSSCPLDEEYNEIKMEDVSFEYKKQKTLLENVSININSPGLYVVVGENGGGKTTLLKLISRFYDTTSGNIYINKKNIKDIPINELRNNIGYYSKEVYLQNDSIISNILLNSKNNFTKSDFQKIDQLCKKLGLSNYINGFKNGYFETVGENGKLLSSGTKQKISIIRALLDKANILLFDEITSDLDNDTEKYVMDLLKELSKKKIIIMVSHRILPILMSDKILYLNNRNILIGTHQMYLDSSKKYRSMFNSKHKFNQV